MRFQLRSKTCFNRQQTTDEKSYAKQFDHILLNKTFDYIFFFILKISGLQIRLIPFVISITQYFTISTKKFTKSMQFNENTQKKLKQKQQQKIRKKSKFQKTVQNVHFIFSSVDFFDLSDSVTHYEVRCVKGNLRSPLAFISIRRN